MRCWLVACLLAAGLAPGIASGQNNPPLQQMPPTQGSLLPPSLRGLPPQLPPAATAPQADTAQAPQPDLQGVPPQDMTPQVPWPNRWLPTASARLQVLDKVNALTTTLVVRVGQAATFESLTIGVKACAIRPPDQPADAAAFLVVTDSHPDMPGFTGWILANEPAVSMMQSAIYDIRVSGCA